MSKICTKCEIEKPLNEFVKHKTCRDGRQGICKDCKSKYQKRYNKEYRKDLKYRFKQIIRERAKRNYSGVKICYCCGIETNIELHHYIEYSFKHALSVIPMCKTCHTEVDHKNIRIKINEADLEIYKKEIME